MKTALWVIEIMVNALSAVVGALIALAIKLEELDGKKNHRS
jgi:hypothetical protein